jgi:hypothetical protein
MSRPFSVLPFHRASAGRIILNFPLRVTTSIIGITIFYMLTSRLIASLIKSGRGTGPMTPRQPFDSIWLAKAVPIPAEFL